MANKRANEDLQEQAITPAPTLRLSENFQSSSADIELRSKDGVRFLVHKANLAVSSTVFADMFETAISSDSERPTIDLEESAEVLERLLPYVYPVVVESWAVSFDKGDDAFVCAIDKYGIPRAVEAVRASLALYYEGHGPQDPPPFFNALRGFGYARLLHLDKIASAFFNLILASLTPLRSSRNLAGLTSRGFDPPGVDLQERIDLASFLGPMFYGLLETYHDFSEGFMMALYGWNDADHLEGAEPQDAVGDYPEHPLSQQAAQTWFDFFPPPVPAWIAIICIGSSLLESAAAPREPSFALARSTRRGGVALRNRCVLKKAGVG